MSTSKVADLWKHRNILDTTVYRTDGELVSDNWFLLSKKRMRIFNGVSLYLRTLLFLRSFLI